MNEKLKQLRKIVKDYTGYYIHTYADPKAESYSNDCLVTFTGCDSQAKVHTSLNLKGAIHNGHTSKVDEYNDTLTNSNPWHRYPDAYTPREGYWGGLYDSQLRSAVACMPNDLEPVFEVSLDAGTSENLIRAKLHGDKLSLLGIDKDGKVRARFLIDTECNPHNLARFGNPTHDNDQFGRGDP